ncbi:hypothetical protein RRG08_062737 [Elysia crispata]|uniref:Uncharacterized protein n=1 Tax=Elysia crispata TaxID=231223 RepID=A0AAE0YZI8_9GAST|nr:hypothetical protein RRG08_062737 [Elysia crispata]
MFRRCYATFKIANEQLMTLHRFSTTIFAGPSHVFGFNNNYKAEPAEAPSGSVGLLAQCTLRSQAAHRTSMLAFALPDHVHLARSVPTGSGFGSSLNAHWIMFTSSPSAYRLGGGH